MVPLQSVTKDVFRSERDIRILAGFYLPLNMTVLRLADGTLMLHSPVELDPAGQAALKALGPVGAIVAPNLMHHKWLAWAAVTYPAARVFAPRALAAKVSGLPPYEPLEDAAEGDIPGVQLLQIDGIPALAEFVFFHEASKSLLVTDVAFNVGARRGLLTPLLLALAGTSKGLASSRFVKAFVKDPQATRASLDRVLAWPFERLLVAHGEAVERAAHEGFAAATDRLAPRG